MNKEASPAARENVRLVIPKRIFLAWPHVVRERFRKERFRLETSGGKFYFYFKPTAHDQLLNFLALHFMGIFRKLHSLQEHLG